MPATEVQPRSQVQAVGAPPPKTWDDYEAGCLATYGGGYSRGPDVTIFRHGMSTVFNLIRREFPDACNPDSRGVAWWMRVAEAKQEERDRALADRAKLVAFVQAVSLSPNVARHVADDAAGLLVEIGE